MGAVAHLSVTWLTSALPGASAAVKGARVFGAIGAGVLTLLIAARALRIDELDQAIALVFRRGRAAAGPAA